MKKLKVYSIGADKVMERWGLNEAQFILLFANHNLRAVYKQYPGEDYEEHSKEGVLKRLAKKEDSLADISIKMEDVLELENSFPVLLGKDRRNLWISHNDLMKRWDLDDYQIDDAFRQLKDDAPESIDPVGKSVATTEMVFMHSLIKLSDVIYRRSDVEHVEKEYDLQVHHIPENNSQEPKPRHNQIQKLKCREIAKKIWEADPDITIEEMIMRDELAAYTFQKDGKTMYASKTLRDWIKDLCPNRDPGRRPKK
jgi:hypothetical protein